MLPSGFCLLCVHLPEMNIQHSHLSDSEQGMAFLDEDNTLIVLSLQHREILLKKSLNMPTEETTLLKKLSTIYLNAKCKNRTTSM